MCIHDNPESVLSKIDEYFLLKPNSIGEPDLYLGAKLMLMQLENCLWGWGLSPSKYEQEATKIQEACGRNLAKVLQADAPGLVGTDLCPVM